MTFKAKKREYRLVAEKEFISITQKPPLLKKLAKEKGPKDKKKARFLLFLLWLTTLVLTGLAIFYREFPRWWRKINGSTTVVSQQFSPMPTVTPAPALKQEREAIEKMIEPLRGKYGLYFQDLTNGEVLAINTQEKFTAASLIKLPVMLTLYREAEAGRIKLDAVYKLQEADRRGGAGSLQYKAVGYEVTYRQLAELMGKQSDNTAFAIVSRQLGAERIQATIDGLGMKNTSFVDNVTTAEDVGIFWERLYRGKVISDKNREEIFSFLTNTIWEDRIPAGLPKEIKVVHKIGTEVRVISDAGIVFAPKPFILVIMSEGVNEIEAKKALPEIARKVYDLREQ